MTHQPAYGPKPGDLERKLAQLFPSEGDRQQARELLERYGTETWHKEVERVQLAALRLAGGDLAELLRSVALANMDYRDVIAAAEYPAFMKLPVGTDMQSAEYTAAIEADHRQYIEWVEG